MIELNVILLLVYIHMYLLNTNANTNIQCLCYFQRLAINSIAQTRRAKHSLYIIIGVCTE